MASKAQRNAQASFFSEMQTMFFGTGTGKENGILGDLKDAADQLRVAADMLAVNTQAKPTYGGPNGGRPTSNGDQTVRPSVWGSGPSGYPGGFSYPGTYSQLRSTIAHQVYTRAGSTGSVFSHGSQFAQKKHADGSVSYEEYSPAGQLVATHNKGDASYEAARTAYGRQQAAGGVATAISSGSVFSSGAGGETHTPGVSMLQGIANSFKSVPVIGPIAGLVAGLIGAPDAVLNSIVNQRAQNAQYQAILGGTNFGTGFHNRRLLEGYRLGQLYSGGFTGKQATEIFNGVTNLGYTGALRDQALNLASSNYKNLGMGPDESLGFISLMAQSTNSDFEQLKTVLNEVSNAAKATGQNLEMARKNLQSLFAIATQSNGGAGSLQAAAGVAQFQTSLGRNFSNVNFSGLLPGQNLGITSMMANATGQSLGAFELQQAGGGPGAKFALAGAQDKQMALVVGSALSNPQIVSVINSLGQRYKQATGNDPHNQISAFTAYCLQDSQFTNLLGAILPQIQAASQAFTGATLNPEQAAEMVIRQALGTSFYTQATQQAAAMQQRTTITPGMSAKNMEMQGITKKGGHYYEEGPTGKLYNVDNQVFTKTTVDPILDKFKAQYARGDVHVKVQTANGEQIVSGQYAYDHLKDQIAKGTAVFVDGPHAGQSVADVVGGGFAESNYKGTTTTNVKANSKHFTSLSAWQSKHGGTGGTVVISPSPALAQLLSISATGNVLVANQSAAAGYPPSPTQTGINLGGN